MAAFEDRLSYLFNNPTFSDVIIELYNIDNKGIQIFAHKNIIASIAEFFEALFRKPPNDIIDKTPLYRINVDDIDIAFELIRWLYAPKRKSFLYKWLTQSDQWLVSYKPFNYENPVQAFISDTLHGQIALNFEDKNFFLKNLLLTVDHFLREFYIRLVFENELQAFSLDFIRETIDDYVKTSGNVNIRGNMIQIRFPSSDDAYKYYTEILKPLIKLNTNNDQIIERYFMITEININKTP